MLPVAAFTVAVTSVLPLGAMLDGLDERVSVVAICAAVTATSTVPEDAPNPVAPV
jgi:hypothetical protein